MDNKHILYITYDGLTDFLGQSQVLPYVLGLEQKGYRFSILSYEKPQKYPADKKIIEDLLKAKNIDWYPLKYHKRFSILATVWDIWMGILFMRRLHKKDPFVAVHCRSYISAIMGLYFKKAFGTKFIFDMRGFWADERVEGGLWNLNNPLFNLVYKLFKRLEKASIIHADATVSLTHSGAVIIRSWKYTNADLNLHIIPCCADLQLFNEQKIRKDLQESLSLSGKTVLSYLGSIGTWYMTSEMMDFYSVYRNKVTNPVFLFITGELRESVLSFSRVKNIPDEEIICIKAQRNDVPSYISVSDHSVFFIKPSFSKKSSSPTKMAEILAMGIPVVCNTNVGDIDMYVEPGNVGAVIKEFTTNEYERAIEVLLNGVSPEVCKALANDTFSLVIGVEKYAAVYRSISL